MDRVDGPQRLGASELGGAIEAALVDRHDVDPFPVVAERPPEVVGPAGVVAEPVDQHQRLGQDERRRAPVVVGGHRLEHDLLDGPSR